MNQSIKEILNKLSKKHNITLDQANEIYKMQFLKVRRTIEEGDKNKIESFKTIGLPNFGKFAFNEKKFLKIQQQQKNK